MHEIARQFKDALESIFYFYLNSLECSRRDHSAKKNRLEQVLRKMHALSSELTTDDAIRQNHIIAIKNYNRPAGDDLLHKVSHLKAVEDSIPGGLFECILGSSVVLETYHLWEEKYRGLIAESSGLQKDDVKNDFWGEARHYRHSIAHNKKRAIKELEKCKLLPLVTEKEPIQITDNFVVKYMQLCIGSVAELDSLYLAQKDGHAQAGAKH